MCPDNLWGKFDLEKIKTPKAVLREQAELLSSMTKGLLQGYVDDRSRGEKFRINLGIEVPALNNYRYLILEVNYGIAFYPLEVESNIADNCYECASEEDFVDVLKQILSSDDVKNVVRGLISQVES